MPKAAAPYDAGAVDGVDQRLRLGLEEVAFLQLDHRRSPVLFKWYRPRSTVVRLFQLVHLRPYLKSYFEERLGSLENLRFVPTIDSLEVRVQA